MNIRKIALSMLNEYEGFGKYVNLSLTSHAADKLTREERASLTALLYTATERKLTYDYLVGALSHRSLDSVDHYTLNILRLGLCQIISMDSVPDYAAVNETVKLARDRGERSFVNGVLREAVRKKADGALPMPERKKNAARYISIAHSFPLWLTRHFISLFGEERTEKIFEIYNGNGHTDLTVNLNKISVSDFVAFLSENGVKAYPSQKSRITVRIDGSVSPTSLPGFSEGFFFVEDTASALAALVLDPAPDSKIIDVCACPGGKSFAAAILAPRGSVTSLDIHESKLSLISDGAARLGVENITVGRWDATSPKPELLGKLDRVICDVPCSGLGVLGKKPDMRYRSPDALDTLPELQYAILEASSRYLCSGGMLVYSTCTLNPRENDEVLDRFLASHEDFAVSDFTVGDLHSVNGRLTLTPDINGTDGFFISRITKKC